MAPVSTAVREQGKVLVPRVPSNAQLDQLLGLGREIVVDWQMSPDSDRR
jgi:hypothetical protein